MQQVPSYMQNAQKSRTDETAQASLPRLSFNLKGEFTYDCGGTVQVLGPTVDVIILAITPPEPNVNHRAYWCDDYSDSAGTAPDCYSENGAIPNKEVAEPQAANCSDCPQAILGSGKGKSAACKRYKLIYGVFANDINTGFIFKVPGTSLYRNKKEPDDPKYKKLNVYRSDLSAVGAPIAGVVTQLSFDAAAEYTRPVFSFRAYLPENLLKITTEMACSDSVERLLTAGVSVPQIEGPKETKQADTKPQVIEEDLFDFGDDDPVQDILDDLASASTKEVLQKKYLAYKPDVATWIQADKIRFKQTTADKLVELAAPAVTSPAAEFAKRLTALTDKSLLSGMAAKAVEYGLHSEFAAKASELNSETYDQEKHGTTKEGLPALCKDGSFKARRGAASKPTEEAKNDEELDSLLSDLGLDEVV